MAQPLHGRCVLIVEDDTMITMLLEDMVAELGGSVAAMAGQEDAAMEAIETKIIDLAILDVNLGGGRSYRIAETLMERDIPFIFSTGYGADSIDSRYCGRPILHKPFRKNELAQALSNAISNLPPNKISR